ncbi:hypothetical protein KO02_11385 [Sphingobacterium sp. ML3W]|uniref:hypothetical protein n=1 Tax=Sphingobacterium sp. ML3W TaxID=1538644 RepID=UPI0004F85260|nr:hypothetical protein [Sphingobacterium sp. ML3W]AIM37226.1 hypothetical protein KO02_11385 [Sphingobacterium sp. ML3W]
MVGKIIINLIIAVIAFPLVFFIKDLIIIDREHYHYDLGNANILDHASIYVKKYIDPITSIIFLLVVLLPIQLLKDDKFKKGLKYSFTGLANKSGSTS